MQPSLLARSVILGLASCAFIAGCQRSEPEQAATAAPPPPAEAAEVAKSPPPAPDYPTHVYFGDTHLHTAMSLDAGVAGARLMPADAYRFAKGEEVTGASGQKAKLSRPLDFLVVTDHSDQMGSVTDLIAGKPEILANPHGQELVRHDARRARTTTRRWTSSRSSRKASFPRRSCTTPARRAIAPRGI